MPEAIKTVELKPAAWFTCDECGTEHIFPLKTDESDVRPADGCVALRVPEKVNCTQCGAVFETEMDRSLWGTPASE